jgi:hypothetical protein
MLRYLCIPTDLTDFRLDVFHPLIVALLVTGSIWAMSHHDSAAHKLATNLLICAAAAAIILVIVNAIPMLM